jgi:hypothetical protein
MSIETDVKPLCPNSKASNLHPDDRNFKFARAFRGYSPRQVDEKLNALYAQTESQAKEISRLHGALAQFDEKIRAMAETTQALWQRGGYCTANAAPPLAAPDSPVYRLPNEHPAPPPPFFPAYPYAFAVPQAQAQIPAPPPVFPAWQPPTGPSYAEPQYQNVCNGV